VQRIRLRHGQATSVAATAFDVRDKSSPSVPPTCAVADRIRDRLILVCDRLDRTAGGFATVEALDPNGRRTVLVPAPRFHGKPMLGFWRSAIVSPDGRTILAQWSGECEVPLAFFAPSAGGRPRPVVGASRPAEFPESVALGWTPNGRATVFFPVAACGSGIDRPGIYAVRPGGTSRLIVATDDSVGGMQMWRRLD
jgi:hypothetical protein